MPNAPSAADTSDVSATRPASASGEVRVRPVAIVGAGALGTALARRLHACGYRMAAVLSRRHGPARRLARAVAAPVASDAVADLPAGVRAVFLCVPDDAIAEVAGRLARQAHPWGGTVVAHTSGAHTARLLAPLAEAGAATLSFHPVQTFPAPDVADAEDADAAALARAFNGICIGIEGMPEAVAYGEQVARDLGGRPLTLAPEAKTRYHLAAALASNGLVTLVALAAEVLASAGIGAADARALLHPLVARTTAHLATDAPEDVLTGPVARGDQQTVAAHAEALAVHLPHLVPAYAALASEMARVAVRSDHLAADAADALLDALREVVRDERP